MYNMDRKELMEFHTALSEESRSLMAKKNSDYADDTSVFGNLDLIEALFCGSNRTTEEGIVIRLGDKLARLAKSTQRELKVADESVRDTVKDIINYAVLFLAKKHERLKNVKFDFETMPDPSGEDLWDFTPDEWVDNALGPAPCSPLHRIYLADQYSNGGKLSSFERAANVARVGDIARLLVAKGHMVHIPHAATAPLDGVLTYEQHMEHDFTLIRLWATALFRGPLPSKGADREVALARDLGRPVWFNIDDVPEIKACVSV